MASISCRHIYKIYPGNVTAVKDFNLEIADKEFIVFVGPSGCGKSTTGRTILRLGGEKTGGQVLFNGKEVYDMTPAEMRELRTKMQIIFQDPFSSLSPRLPVGEIIGEAVREHNLVPKAEFNDYIDQVMDNCGLQPYHKTRYPHELSGGQRQALTLLMATLVTPKLLLLDEHTAALDPATADKVLELTKKIVAENHITCLMITHNMHAALELGNRTLMMDSGHIVLDISGEERANTTVDGLLDQFAKNVGRRLDNDRILLSRQEETAQ